MTNRKHLKDTWRSIRLQYDQDKNGFITTEEFEEQFYQYFPQALEGKSMCNLMKQYLSFYDKTLINYKQIKDEIDTAIRKRLKDVVEQPSNHLTLEPVDFVEKQQLNSKNLSRLNELRNLSERNLNTGSILQSIGQSQKARSRINLLTKEGSLSKLSKHSLEEFNDGAFTDRKETKSQIKLSTIRKLSPNFG